MESLSDALASQLQGTDNNRQASIVALNGAMMGISTVAVALRLVSRRVVCAPFRYDDYAVVWALFTSYGLSIISIVATHYGMGKHIIEEDFSNIVPILKCVYAYFVMYPICVPAIKMSILLFFYRIFTTQPAVNVLRFFGLFIALWQTSATLVGVFQCTPIHSFWDKSIDGVCINSYLWSLSEGGITIFIDVVLLVIPMPMVWQLQISWRQKAALSAIFLLGGFVCVASIIRMFTLHEIFTNDSTWTIYAPEQWSVVEANLGIVCACLPVMRPLIRHRYFGSTRGTKPSTQGSNTIVARSSLGQRKIKMPWSLLTETVTDETTHLSQPSNMTTGKLWGRSGTSFELQPTTKTARGTAQDMLPDATQRRVDPDLEWGSPGPVESSDATMSKRRNA